MRRQDEVELYRQLRESVAGGDGPTTLQPGPSTVYALTDRIGIHRKRLHAILYKWTDRGWWEWGCSPQGGWFTEKAPEALTP